MKAVIQRVLRARVLVDGEPVGEINEGLLALVAFEKGDDEAVAKRTAEKLVHLRVFEDEAGKMNLSALDAGRGILLVPNFTVAGSTRKGHRPSFDGAMEPEGASRLFDILVETTGNMGVKTARGIFGAHMQVELVNDGPVTVIIELKGDS
ncbi:MAG: D-aminoacyl-tRNA deacylase [candidate division WOR-3 bacterium]